MEQLDFNKGAIPLYIQIKKLLRIKSYPMNMPQEMPFQVRRSCKNALVYHASRQDRRLPNWKRKDW